MHLLFMRVASLGFYLLRLGFCSLTWSNCTRGLRQCMAVQAMRDVYERQCASLVCVHCLCILVYFDTEFTKPELGVSVVAVQAMRDGVQEVAVKVLAASQFSGIAEGIQLQVLKKVCLACSASPLCNYPAEWTCPFVLLLAFWSRDACPRPLLRAAPALSNAFRKLPWFTCQVWHASQQGRPKLYHASNSLVHSASSAH